MDCCYIALIYINIGYGEKRKLGPEASKLARDTYMRTVKYVEGLSFGPLLGWSHFSDFYLFIHFAYSGLYFKFNYEYGYEFPINWTPI